MGSALILRRERCHIHIQLGPSRMDMLERQDMRGLLFSFDAVTISPDFSSSASTYICFFQ